jgi:DNA uptake protein ComE-like DNA-binding protein
MRSLMHRGKSMRRQRGFALAMTLWILAAIMVAATIFSERVRQAVNLAQRQQKTVDAQLELAATNAEILFRLGSMPISLYGLGDQPDGKSIYLDNRMYHGIGSATVQLQDARGLVNLNVVSDERLLRLLSIVDVPADKRGMLIDTLRDYMDEDSLKRINGAEEPEYRERGLPPPRNENLLTPYEARSIIGWRDLPQLWENNRLPDLITISTAVAVNPNTASKEVLATLPGVTSEIADAIIARRQLAPIASPDVIAQMVGAAPGDYLLNIITLPADSVRVTLRSPDLPWAIQYNVSLSPNNDKTPWRIDYYYKIRQDASPPPPPPTASPLTNPFTSPSNLFVTPGLSAAKANEIPELPPRNTIAVSTP